MRIFTLDSFLTKGSGTIPEGAWVGVGIHPSSEVDLMEVGGVRCGVGAIVPLRSGDTAKAVRSLNAPDIKIIAAALNALGPADGNLAPNDKLVIQVYEECDPWNPPGKRVPYNTQAIVTAPLPTTQATAKLIARIPMCGRASLAMWCQPIAGIALTVGFQGMKYPKQDSGNGFTQVDESVPFAIGVATIVSGPIAGGQNSTFSQTIGGIGSIHDEVTVWAWSAGGGNASFQFEAFGER